MLPADNALTEDEYLNAHRVFYDLNGPFAGPLAERVDHLPKDPHGRTIDAHMASIIASSAMLAPEEILSSYAFLQVAEGMFVSTGKLRWSAHHGQFLYAPADGRELRLSQLMFHLGCGDNSDPRQLWWFVADPANYPGHAACVDQFVPLPLPDPPGTLARRFAAELGTVLLLICARSHVSDVLDCAEISPAAAPAARQANRTAPPPAAQATPAEYRIVDAHGRWQLTDRATGLLSRFASQPDALRAVDFALVGTGQHSFVDRLDSIDPLDRKPLASEQG